MTEPTQPLSLARLYQLRLTLDAAAEGSGGRDDMVDTFAEAEELLDDALLVRGMFTWADVDGLRDAADRLDRESGRANDEFRSGDAAFHEMTAHQVREIADRLASILPPRAS